MRNGEKRKREVCLHSMGWIGGGAFIFCIVLFGFFFLHLLFPPALLSSFLAHLNFFPLRMSMSMSMRRWKSQQSLKKERKALGDWV